MEMFSLKNKNIIVTGALGLLGKEHVKAIASAGGNPIMLDIDNKRLLEFSQHISKKYNVNSIGFEVDITQENSIKNNCEIVKSKFDKLDGLINNAANNPKVENNKNNFNRLENFPMKLWDDDLNVSLRGSFLCCKYYGNLISKNPNGGSIINVSSDLGLIAPNQSLYKEDGVKEESQKVKPITYSVVKHGIIGLTRYLATYWGSNNVRSNAICPGAVFNDQKKDFVQKISKMIPLGRMAKKNDLHGIIVYLLSDSSSYMNGSIISIDGGRVVW